MEIDQEELTLCKIEQAEIDGKAKGLAEGKIIGLGEGEAKFIQKALKKTPCLISFCVL